MTGAITLGRWLVWLTKGFLVWSSIIRQSDRFERDLV